MKKKILLSVDFSCKLNQVIITNLGLKIIIFFPAADQRQYCVLDPAPFCCYFFLPSRIPIFLILTSTADTDPHSVRPPDPDKLPI